jgi:hypothetical protein
MKSLLYTGLYIALFFERDTMQSHNSMALCSPYYWIVNPCSQHYAAAFYTFLMTIYHYLCIDMSLDNLVVQDPVPGSTLMTPIQEMADPKVTLLTPSRRCPACTIGLASTNAGFLVPDHI